MKQKKFTVVDLFAGAGGLSEGFRQVGFDIIAANDNWKPAVDTFRANHGIEPILGNICDSEVFEKVVNASKNVDVVIGGPPCQSFSVIGRRNGTSDKNGAMVYEFIKFISKTMPSVFVMENVRGILSIPVIPKKMATKKTDEKLTESGSLIKDIVKRFNSLGYRVDCYVVNSVNYGAPQIRERVMLIGNKHGLLSEFQKPQYSNRPSDGLPPFRVLRDAIGNGFKDNYPEVMDFSPRKLKYLSFVPPGGNWRSMPIEIQKESMGKSWYLKGGRSAYWRRLSFDFPSPTVVTMPNHAGTSMCHPKENRAISVGEVAAIQEFPRNWKFYGTTSEKYRQIGNAVPIRLAKVAGEAAKNLVERIHCGERPNHDSPMHREIHLRPHVRTKTYWKNGKAYSGNVSYYQNQNGTLKSYVER
jgi:DNA (cytosine-5)-methyltransferase 1